MISQADRDRIEAAVRDAELQTDAEFVCVVSEEASDYSGVPFLWAAVFTMIVPLVPLILFAFILQVREAFLGWIVSPSVSEAAPVSAMAFYGSLQCLAFLIVLVLLSIPSVRRATTPRGLKRRFVRQRALEQFVGKGLGGSARRNSVLLFASPMDECAEVIADVGITAQAGQQTWADAASVLTRCTRKGQIADGMIAAIGVCRRDLAARRGSTDQRINAVPDALTDLTAGPGVS